MGAINKSIASELVGFVNIFGTGNRLEHRADDYIRIDHDKFKRRLGFFHEVPL